MTVGAVVVRCFVWEIAKERGVVYRGALRFAERCDRLAPHAPRLPAVLPAAG